VVVAVVVVVESPGRRVGDEVVVLKEAGWLPMDAQGSLLPRSVPSPPNLPGSGVYFVCVCVCVRVAGRVKSQPAKKGTVCKLPLLAGWPKKRECQNIKNFIPFSRNLPSGVR
jgi:hypothetical protein